MRTAYVVTNPPPRRVIYF